MQLYFKVFANIHKLPKRKQLLIHFAIVNYYYFNMEPQLDKKLQAVFEKLRPFIKGGDGDAR